MIVVYLILWLCVVLCIFAEIHLVILCSHIVDGSVFTPVDDAGEAVEHWDVVGGHDYGRACGADVFEQADNLAGGVGVEVSGGFIGDNDFGLVEDGKVRKTSTSA